MPQIFDMLGWAEAAPGTGAVPVAAGLSDFIRHNADLDGIIPLARHQWLIGLFAASCATLERTMIRQTGLPLDHEFMKACLMDDNDPAEGYTCHYGVPLPIVSKETLWCYVDNAGDEDVIVGAQIGAGAIRTAPKEAVSATDKLIGYGDTTSIALTWTNIPIVWNQTPKKGRYAVLGMLASCYDAAHGISLSLARLKIPGMLDWRPGVPVGIAEGAHKESFQSMTAQLYKIWGQLSVPSTLSNVFSFTDDQLPDIEVLSNNTIDDWDVELLIRRIADR